MSGDEQVGDPLSELRRGRHEPFEAYVRAHGASLCLYFRRRGLDAGGAADLAQEVFMRLLRSADRYVARERFDAYVARVAARVWIDQRRRDDTRGRRNPLDKHAEEVLVEPELGAALEALELHERLRRAMALLSDAQRRTLELALLEERPYAEVAVRLGVPVGTVKSRVFHALAKLRAVIEPEAPT
jgi:RNA polymerase sigma-70 factor, ECF subfamily